MATLATPTSAKSWAPDVSTFAAQEVIPDALILQTSTVSGNIEGDAPALRIAFVNDANATFTAENGTIAESTPELDEVLVYTAKITQLVNITNEQYRQDGTAQQLSSSVQRAIVKKANEAYLTQIAPTAPAVAPTAGLLNVAGIENGGAVSADLDALVDLIATLEGNGGTPSHIVLDPTGWASLRKFKTGAGAATTLLGAGTSDAERRLLDLPVLVSNAMTAGSGVVLDRSAVVSAVGQVHVATSEHVNFNRDGIALRATWRLGWNLVHPDRIGKFSVTTPAE